MRIMSIRNDLMEGFEKNQYIVTKRAAKKRLF